MTLTFVDNNKWVELSLSTGQTDLFFKERLYIGHDSSSFYVVYPNNTVINVYPSDSVVIGGSTYTGSTTAMYAAVKTLLKV